jgi:hypothetical protein
MSNVLTITELEPEDRPYVTYRGQPYYYRLPATLGLRDHIRYLNLRRELGTVWVPEPTDEQDARADQVLRELVALIVDAPEAVRDKWGLAVNFAVYDAYRSLPDFLMAPTERAALPESPSARPTSAATSPASAASTAPVTG